MAARGLYLDRAFLLCASMVSLLSRPLASTVNDKLELQECLEHGRIAKVSLSTPDSGVGVDAWQSRAPLDLVGCYGIIEPVGQGMGQAPLLMPRLSHPG